MTTESQTLDQDNRLLWMLGALTSGFILSMAFRTIIAISAEPLAFELRATAQALGTVAGVFHIAFALSQPFVGVALDRYGPRRVVTITFLLTVIGSAVSASANNLTTLVIGQCLIGIGCSPALLAAMLFISQRYPFERFAAVSGAVLSAGGAGMLLTGTPLAWVIETFSWRVGFIALMGMAAASWIAVVLLVKDKPTPSHGPPQTLREELNGLALILRQPHTIGICCLAATSYAAFLALRGLWIGPLLAERHGFSLIEIGHVAFAISLLGVLGPLFFGRIDPGGFKRRRLIIGCSLGYIVLFVTHAIGVGSITAIALLIITGFIGGYVSLQYADLRSAYPDELTGRALSVFTMAMFSGVAGVQWLSGIAASLSLALGLDPLTAALFTVSALLALGTFSFWRLPQPPNIEIELSQSKTETS